MNCETMRELLTGYALGALDTAQKELVDKHLEQCCDCRASLQEIRSTLDLVQGALAATQKAPAHLAQEKRQAVLNTPPPAAPVVPAITWLTRHRPMLAKVAALLVVGFVLFSLITPSFMKARNNARRAACIVPESVDAARGDRSYSYYDKQSGAPDAQAQATDDDGEVPTVYKSVMGDHGRNGDSLLNVNGDGKWNEDEKKSDRERKAEGVYSFRRSGGKGAVDGRHGNAPGWNTLGPRRDSENWERTPEVAQTDSSKTIAPKPVFIGTPRTTKGTPAPDSTVAANGTRDTSYRLPEIVNRQQPTPSDKPSDGHEVSPATGNSIYWWGERDQNQPASAAPGEPTTLQPKGEKKRETAGEAGGTLLAGQSELNGRQELAKSAAVKNGTVTGVTVVDAGIAAAPKVPVIGGIPVTGRLFYGDGKSGGESMDKVKETSSTVTEDPREASARSSQDSVLGLCLTVTNSYTRPEINGCVSNPDSPAPVTEAKPAGPIFKAIGQNPIVYTKDNAFSTFAMDVDTASYTLARNYMQKGFLPPAEAVRTEEFVNFFDYACKPPADKAFAIYTDCAPTPFQRGLHLLKIGVEGKRLARDAKHRAVLTFVIDTSGSMSEADRLPLIRRSLRLLIDQLDPADSVAIVQYDSHARLVLDRTPVAQKKAILNALDGLQTSGSTNLEEGMRAGYDLAARRFVPGAANRVLLLSDGAANLGSVEATQILGSVEAYRKQGIYCSVFGFGIGTYNDDMLKTLASKGDGTYSFVDSMDEAQRVFVDKLAGTLNVIAKDAKIQVEFNPERVKRYRQIGYEQRQLTKEQFRDDTVDAGEVGAGQSVTALYELELDGKPQGVIGTVRVRYMNTETGKVEEFNRVVTQADVCRTFEGADVRFKLAACVAEFAEILRGSDYAKGIRFSDVAAVLRPVALELTLDNRLQELLRMVEGASSMSRVPAQ